MWTASVSKFPVWWKGVGTNLFGYRVYMSKRLRIPLSELKFRSVKAEDGEIPEDRFSLSAQRHFRPVERYQRSSPSDRFPKFRIPVSKKND